MNQRLDFAHSLHAESLIIDAVSPLAAADPKFLNWYREGSVTVLAPTVSGPDDAKTTLFRLASWHRLLNDRKDVVLIRSAAEIELSKLNGTMGVYFHLQGTEPLEGNIDLIDLYKALGVGMIQLTYNKQNAVGSGCEEADDRGLSSFGKQVVDRLNKCSVIVDCSHTGERTSLDAIERSAVPVVASHSNVASVFSCARNLSDRLVKAIGESGGVVGLAGFPGMISRDARPSIDQFIAHVDAVVNLAGVDHVGLGIDYYAGQAGVADDAVAVAAYEENRRSGIWGPAYPPPPHHYPAGIEDPRTLGCLTEQLLHRGYGLDEVRKIMGGNWLRLMRDVWG